MPSETQKQHNFMGMIKHSPEMARKTGVPQSVGAHFIAADKKAGKFSEGGHVMGKTMRMGHTFGKDGRTVSTLQYAKGGTVHNQVARRVGGPNRAAAAARQLAQAMPASPGDPGVMAGPAPRGRRLGPPMAAPGPALAAPGPMAGDASTAAFKKGGRVDKWQAGAVKRPGALTRKADKAGKTPMAFAHEHYHDSGRTGQQARYAVNAQKGRHAEGGLIKGKASIQNPAAVRGFAKGGKIGDVSGEFESKSSPISHGKTFSRGGRGC
jgi:hypothetical protein